MPVTEGTGGCVARWQLALAVGAPVALGLGYMYYKSNNSNVSDRHGKSKKKGVPADKPISVHINDVSASVSLEESKTPSDSAAQIYKKEGNTYFKIGKYDKAIAQYNMAIKACPQTNVKEVATFYQNRAAAYEQLKKYDAVKADCTKAIELKPKYIKALLRRARASEFLGELESAVEDVTVACIYEGFRNEMSLTVADRLLKELVKRDIDEHLKNRKYTMPSKHFVKTYMSTFPDDPVFSRLQHAIPEDFPKVYKKVLQALKHQKYDDIISLCTEAIDNSEFKTLPYNMEILLLRATFYLLVGRQSEALEDLDEIIYNNLTSKNVELNAHIKRGTLYVQLEEIDTALQAFETAIQIDPTCSDIYHHRGMTFLVLGRLEEAKNDFEKGILYNPNFCAGYMQKCYADFRVAYANRDRNELENITQNIDAAFEKFPDNPEAYMMCGQMLCENRDFEKADVFFRKAIELDPKNGNTLVQRALLEIQWHGDSKTGIEQAVHYIQKALKVDEKCELGYETLGSIEVQRGNLEEAIKLYEKALELCRTTMDLKHLYGLRNATKTQLTIKNKFGLVIKDLPNIL